MVSKEVKPGKIELGGNIECIFYLQGNTRRQRPIVGKSVWSETKREMSKHFG